MKTRHFPFSLLVAVLAGCSGASPLSRVQLFPETPEKIILLSLDGRETARIELVESFHFYPVLGKTEIVDKNEQANLMNSLRDGIARRPERAPKCFVPRLGMIVRYGGDTLDYVICFECSGTEIYRGGEKIASELINKDIQEQFDKRLNQAGKGELYVYRLKDGSTTRVSTNPDADYRYPHGEAAPC